MSKHTPGPWRVERDGLILAPDGTTPAICNEYPELLETRANAQLIACAPEMLKKLEHIYNWLGVIGEYREDVKALIEKAKGA